MSRIRLILLSALSGATIAPPAHAQSLSDSIPTDSVVAPAPKKGGGLFGKIKKVAANKTVQGVAKGVACNAVPGAAVAAAAAGSTACPAGGIGGMAGGMPGGGGVPGALGGAVGGAIGARANAATTTGMIPNGGVMPNMAGMSSMAGMMSGMSAVNGMAVNEEAAAKCMGITLQEYRDAMNVTPDAATRKRQEAVREKLEQGRAGPSDMNACAAMMQAPTAPTPRRK